jgi:hypothetical protein
MTIKEYYKKMKIKAMIEEFLESNIECAVVKNEGDYKSDMYMANAIRETVRRNYSDKMVVEVEKGKVYIIKK